MKKCYYLISLLCIFSFATGLFARESDVRDLEGRVAYGILLRNPDDGYRYGIGRFNTSTPEQVEILHAWGNDYSIYSGAGANDEYYGFFYHYDNVTGPVPETFSKINLRTGECTMVKDWSEVYPKLQDMTYDYSTQIMYAIGFEDGFSYLYTIDLASGDLVRGPAFRKNMATLAATYDGRLFALDLYGVLYAVDKETADLTLVLETGAKISSMQSMEFDHTDECLYWCSDVEDNNSNALYKIDVDKKTCKRLGGMGSQSTVQVIGLYIPFVLAGFDAPGEATELKVVPAEKGENKATVSWTNPVKTHGGAPLSGSMMMTLKRDGEIISSSLGTAGAKMSWSDNNVDQGQHIWTVVASVGDAEGAKANVDKWVGKDVPDYVDGLQLAIGEECKSVKLSWNTPTEGAHGGYYDGSKVTFTITRYPDKQVIVENSSANSYEDKSLSRLGSYYYGIVARNEAGASVEYLSDYKIVAGKAENIPYSCEFNDAALAKNQWNVVDGNNDGLSWYINSGFNKLIFDDDVFSAEYIQDQQTSQVDADEWLISPPLNFEADKDYYVSFDVRSAGEDQFNFTFGDLNVPSSQTVIVPALATMIDSNELQNHKIQLPRELTTEGVHCFGFNLVTYYGWSMFFQITNISIEEGLVSSIDTTVEGNKVKVMQEGDHLSVTGEFDFAEVYNATGLRVASIDNSETGVCTTGWKAGLYLVRIANTDTTYKVIIK